MKEVYVLSFYPKTERFREVDFFDNFEICETKELAIECAKEYLKRHFVEEIKQREKDGKLQIWGVANEYYGYQVDIKKKEVFSSVETFLPSQFLYLRKNEDTQD